MLAREQAPQRRHAAAQPPATQAEVAELSMTAAPAADSGVRSDTTSELCARDKPPSALVGEHAILALAPEPTPGPAELTLLKPQQPEAQRAAAVRTKSKPKAALSAPAASDAPAVQDSKRSISKLLAF
jgi:hypothetical protein